MLSAVDEMWLVTLAASGRSTGKKTTMTRFGLEPVRLAPSCRVAVRR